jgi:hypothetical protein
MDIATAQNIGAEGNVGWLAADRCNVVLHCDFTTCLYLIT